MKFPVLASVILFCAILARAIRRNRNSREKAERIFWQRENQANNVRRKSLENLDYIHIPLDNLPTRIMAEHPQVAESLRLLQELSEQKILNLTGYTNTDLKMQYGAANLPQLMEYDQSYTVLARTLQIWADVLWEAQHRYEAVQIMEFAVETRTDVSRTYYLLAEYYASRGDSRSVERLISAAEELRSANKKIIVHTLKESYS